MLYPPSLSRLIEAFRCLPGVGPKSAQRMAFHLLERDRGGGNEIALSVANAMEKLGHCQRCRMFAEGELCPVCASTGRDHFAAVRGGIAGRRGRDRADGEFSRLLLRADGSPVAARRRGARRDRHRAISRNFWAQARSRK